MSWGFDFSAIDAMVDSAAASFNLDAMQEEEATKAETSAAADAIAQVPGAIATAGKGGSAVASVPASPSSSAVPELIAEAESGRVLVEKGNAPTAAAAAASVATTAAEHGNSSDGDGGNDLSATLLASLQHAQAQLLENQSLLKSERGQWQETSRQNSVVVNDLQGELAQARALLQTQIEQMQTQAHAKEAAAAERLNAQVQAQKQLESSLLERVAAARKDGAAAAAAMAETHALQAAETGEAHKQLLGELAAAKQALLDQTVDRTANACADAAAEGDGNGAKAIVATLRSQLVQEKEQSKAAAEAAAAAATTAAIETSRMQGEVSALRSKLEEATGKLATELAAKDTASEELRAASAALAKSQAELVQLTNNTTTEKERLEAALVQAMHDVESSQASVLALTSQTDEYTKKSSETDTKVEYLSNKLRDVMKVYGEGKQKLKKFQTDLESAVEAKITIEESHAKLNKKMRELQANLDNSEAEVVGMEEASQKLTEQHRNELKLCRSKNAELETRLELEKSSWTEAAAESHALQLQDAKQAADRSVKETIRKMHQMEEAHNSTLSELQEQLLSVQEQQRDTELTSKNHEAYKTRAQQARKAANAKAAQKAAEVEKLQQQLDEAHSSATGSGDTLAKMSTHTQELESQLNELKNSCFTLKNSVAALEEANDKLTQKCADTECSLESEKTAAADAASKAAKQLQAAIAAEVASSVGTAAASTTSTSSTASSDERVEMLHSRSPEPRLESSSTPTRSLARGSPGSASNGNPGDNLYYVGALKGELELLRAAHSARGGELETSHRALQNEKEAVLKLTSQREELIAFIDRSKQADPGNADSTVNMEYLKNCICRFMAAVELKEKKQLFPVIATVLHFSASEKDEVNAAFAAQEKYALEDRVTAGLTAGLSRFFGSK